MSDELRWDPRRHDDTVEKFQSLEANKRGRELVAKIYIKWKRRLIKRKRTPQELIAELYKLRDMVADAVKHSPGMTEWRIFTMNFIEDKISEALRADFGSKNILTEWLSEDRRQGSDALVVSEQAEFTNLEEFMAIPFVRRFLVLDGFVGFFSSALFINALFDDGEIQPVGTVVNNLGLEKLPTHREIAESLAKSPGETESSTTSTPDGGLPPTDIESGSAPEAPGPNPS